MSQKTPEGRNTQDVRDALSTCMSFEDVSALGILFHGTCEEIDGDPKGGGYDNVFWTARTPSVAQGYIPKSGITTWLHAPDDDDRKRAIEPTQSDGFVMRWALEKSGATRDDLEIVWNGWHPWSFTVVDRWPNEGDFDDWIKSHGYVADGNGVYKVSMMYIDSRETLMPADWTLPGHLLIVLPDKSFNEVEPAWSDDAMGYESHNRVADFAGFSSAGIDAFAMEDSLQSDHLGNVGHEAVGILASGLPKISWLAIPAVRHDGITHDAFRISETAAFVDFMKEINPEYRSEADIALASCDDNLMLSP